jgi:hypothetical protein
MKPFQMDSQALVALAHDAVALTLSWAFAFALLRVHGAPAVPGNVTVALVVAIPLQARELPFGVWGIWRYTSLPDISASSFRAREVAVALFLHATGPARSSLPRTRSALILVIMSVALRALVRE